MHLSPEEYEEMKARFHCVSVSDEQYCGPFDVDAAVGGHPWRVYVEGSQFREACQRVKQRRDEV